MASPAVVSRDHLLQSLAGWDKDITPNAVEVHVSRLRAPRLRAAGSSCARCVASDTVWTRPVTERAGRRFAPFGLRARLYLWLAVPLLVILVVSAALDYRTARRIADQTQDQILADSLFDLEGHLKAQTEARRSISTRKQSAILRSNAPDVLFYAVRDAAGRA